MRDVRIIVGLLALSVVVAPAASAARTRGNAAALPDVEIRYQTFTLDNGLRVIVSTDRKAPVVAVGVWYGVGSREEHPGITGFAHLFEHLMFNGSGHYNEDYFGPSSRSAPPT